VRLITDIDTWLSAPFKKQSASQHHQEGHGKTPGVCEGARREASNATEFEKFNHQLEHLTETRLYKRA